MKQILNSGYAPGRRHLLAQAAAMLFACLPLMAAEIVKENNTDPLDTGASWVGNTAPGADDTALWNNRVLGPNTSPLAAAVTWNGIKVANPGGPVTVTGSSKLTLDGGAGTDIDLSAATQDLTLAVPVILGNAQAMNVAAGRTLTFSGQVDILQGGEWNRTGTGTVVFDGAVTSSVAATLEFQSGTNVFTGKNGGLLLTATGTGASRLYVGRRNNNYATLIISNGVHETRATSDEANANLIGVGGSDVTQNGGRLIVENGTLRVPYMRTGINDRADGGITVNGGLLEITHGSATADRAGYGLMIANNHQNNTTAIADNIRGFLTVNGGMVSVANGIISLGSQHANSTGSAAVTLNGGELAAKRLYMNASPAMPKTVTLNGGLLRLTGGGKIFDGPGAANGSLTLIAGTGGARIDTGANDLTLDTPLTGTGGLDKSGSGMLTLTAANTYAGRTRVLAGVMRFTGASATPADLMVASGAGISLADGTLADFAPAAISFGGAMPVRIELETAANSSDSDRIVLSGAAPQGGIVFSPVVQGTAARSLRVGDYVVLAYTGAAPDVARFTVSDPAPMRAYSFILDDQAKTVTLRIGYAAGVSEWAVTSGGAWGASGNWTALPADAAGTSVRFGPVITGPATVTASSSVTLGNIAFDSAIAYTLTGQGFTFDNNAAAATIAVNQGAHIINAPLALNGDLAVKPASDAAVTLSGVVGGTGRLVKDGAGGTTDLTLTQPNTYSGGTVIKQGSIVLSGTATLGSGPVTVAENSGIRVMTAAAPTLDNDFAIDSTFTINASSSGLVLTGEVDWRANGVSFIKTGGNDLVLSGRGSETALSRFNIENGRLVFGSGAEFALMNASERDAFSMKGDNTNIREVVIEEGASVTASGIDMERGAQNNIRINGGTLRLLGGGSNNDALAMRGQGAGTDRFIVNTGTLVADDGKWLGIGYRAGDAYFTVNGGTASVSRVSLGARENDSTDLNARSFVEINGGLFEVRGQFNWMGSSVSGRTNIVTLSGGVWRTVATMMPRDKGGISIMRFNGGTLETLGTGSSSLASAANYLGGAKEVYVDAGGARVDTRGLDVAVTQPLQSGTTPGGGLTKLGAGSLTLKAAAAFTGPTAVEQGTLVLPASYASGNAAVAAGATLSLMNGAAQTLTLASANFANGAVIALEAGDVIALPAGATVGDIAVKVVAPGTDSPIGQTGDNTTLFTFTGAAPSVTGWTLLNPVSECDASFEIVGSSVVLRVAPKTGVSIWNVPGSGDWGTPENWSSYPGTFMWFAEAITGPATVTVNTPAIVVDALSFRSAAPYTLAGSGITLNAGGTVVAERGTHAVNVPLTLGNDARIEVAAGAGLSFCGMSGAAPTVSGPGEIAIVDPVVLAVPALTLEGAAAVTITNTATWTNLVTLGAGGGVFAPAADTTLDITAAVDGIGGLTKRGSSVLEIGNAYAQYIGGTRVEAGTLRIGTLPAGGITFGQGTLEYTGGQVTYADGYTLDTGNGARAGILRTDADITFQGNINALSGAWIKTGQGTVAFTAPGLNVYNIGNGAGTSHEVLDIGPNGDSPTVGFSGFNVADGTVVIGAEGQTNVFNGLLVVGLNSTTVADAETAGELSVTGGVTTVTDALIIGRSNGTAITAETPRTSRLHMTGGELNAFALVVGRVSSHVAGGFPFAPEAEIEGGTFTALDTVILGEKTDVSATLTLNGGTLVTPKITRGTGEAHLIFDGGVFRPSKDSEGLQGLTTLRADARGATFDLSLIDAFYLGQAITGDGGFTKTGAGVLVFNAKQAYTGTTVVEDGRLRLTATGGLPNGAALAVEPGAELAFDAATIHTVNLSTLTLGDAAPATPAMLTFKFSADGTTNDLLAVGGTVDLGTVDLTLLTAGRTDAFGQNGTYTLMTYTGTAPGLSGLRVTNKLYGKAYTFAAADGSVTLTISVDYAGGTGGAAVWKHTGGGDWATSGNWTALPANAPGASARLDSSITAPAEITVAAPATVGELFFNSTNGYTLAGTGPLALDSGADDTPAALNIEAGSHTFALPVTVADAGLEVRTTENTETLFAGNVSGSGPLVKSGYGDLAFSGANDRTGLTEMSKGALVLHNGGTPGTGEIVINKEGAGIRVTGTLPATLDNTVTLDITARLNARDQALTLAGPLAINDGLKLQKHGTNQVVFSGTGGSTGSGTLQISEGPATFGAAANYTFSSASGEAVLLGSIANLRTSLTIEDGASITAGGLAMSTDSGDVAECDAAVTQNGGSVYLTHTDAFSVRRNGVSPATYVMNGGTLSMPPTSWANVGIRGDGIIMVNGGEMTLGRFAAGYQTRTTANGKGAAHVVVNGGRLTALSSWSWMSDGTARATLATLNGGTLAIPATAVYGANAANWTGLTLDGGMMEFTGPAVDNAATDDYLRGARRVAVGPRGGTLYAGAADVTVRQNVDGLAATGTLAKAGGAAVTLAGTNTLAALDVREGTLRARLAHVGDLPGVPLFRYKLGEDGLLADSSGHGFTLARNGTGAATAGHDGTADGAWLFNNDVNFQIAHSPLFPQVTEFTVSAWIHMTAISTGSDWSILSARPSGTVRAFEFKINNGGALRLLMHNDMVTSSTWWNDIMTTTPVPINRWVHVAVSVSRERGAKLYVDGVPQAMRDDGDKVAYTGNGWPRTGDIRLTPLNETAGLLIGRSHKDTNNRLRGSLDDVMLFDRVLSDAELAQIHAGTAPRLATVNVDGLGTYDLQGETQAVSEASGSGMVINGTLAVEERLAAGLTIANLTLGADVVYACPLGEGGACGFTDVTGTLTVAGAGVIDFGRTSANPVSKSFEAVVMTYGTVSGAENLANWTVTGIGLDNFQATVAAESGEIVVRVKTTFGTLMILK